MLNVRKKSQKQEKRVARELNGRQTIASGALAQKADVHSADFCVECKTTKECFYNLKVETWKKICKEALKNANGRRPLLIIDLNDAFGNTRETLVAMPMLDDQDPIYGYDVRVHQKKVHKQVKLFDSDFEEGDYILNVSFTFEWEDGIGITVMSFSLFEFLRKEGVL